MRSLHRALFRRALHFLRRVLCRRALYTVNVRLHTLSLHGLGIMNYENDTVTGQNTFLGRFAEAARRMGSPTTIVDVGANVGAFSVKLRQLLPTSNIYAFEPHPRTFIQLKQEASKWHFEAFNCGCSDSRAVATIYDRADQQTTEHASLYKAVIEEIHRNASTSCEVRLIALDELIVSHRITKIHLLKIDTEGHEHSVLRGAEKMIKIGGIDVVQFEFNEMNVISRTFLRDFVTLLPAYAFYRMLPDGLIPIDPTPLRSELFGFQNIVAIRRDVADLYSLD